MEKTNQPTSSQNESPLNEAAVAADAAADAAAAPAAAPAQVAPGFLFSMREAAYTMRFPQLGFAPEYYVTAKPAGIGNDDIIARGTDIRFGDTKGTSGGSMFLRPGAAFVGKCIVQITDFAIPVADEDGKHQTMRYKSENNGDNYHNRRLYERLLTKEAAEIRHLLEGFLDSIDGRDTDAQTDFDDAKNAQPLLLTTS